MKTKKLSDGWQEVELGEIAEVFNGKTPSEAEKREQGTPILKIKDVTEQGYFKGTFDSFVDTNFYNKYSDKIVKIGDTLILNAAHNSEYVGSKTFYVKDLPNNTIATGEWLIIRAKPNLLDSKFKHYLVISSIIRRKIKDFVKGIHLYPKDVKLIKIPLPPLSIQKKIVTILEKAEALKQKREEADKLTKEYLQSVFYEMFLNKGFEEVELGTVCEFNPKKAEIRTINENLEVSFVPMADVQEHQIYFDLKDIKKIKDTFSGYTYFKENDVLLAKVTPCFENGKSGIAKNLKNGIGFGSSEFFVLRPSDKILSPLIYYLISSSKFIQAGKRQMSGTGGLKRLSKNYVTEYKIPLPPFALQQKFASIVEHIEKLKEKQKQSKEKINEMFSALMQKAFNGELVR